VLFTSTGGTAHFLTASSRSISTRFWAKTSALQWLEGILLLFLLWLVRSIAFVLGAPSNHSIQKLCCGRRMRRRWLNLDSPVFGKNLHHGPSPEERGVRRTAARPRSGVRVVFGWCELLRAEPRQRVHVPAASRKIRVFLSNGVKEWYDGGRISGNCVCVCPRVRASCYRRARARARSPMLMASRRCALTWLLLASWLAGRVRRVTRRARF